MKLALALVCLVSPASVGFLITAPVSAQGLPFPEAHPLYSISTPDGQGQVTPIPNPSGGNSFCYAPPDVEDENFGNGEPHPAQFLTVFWPIPNPAPGQVFPTVMYCTAGVFLQGDGSIAGNPGAFLCQAVADGWCVITVGSVGYDSWPTCSQYVECTDPLCDCTVVPNCGQCNATGQNPNCPFYMAGSCWDPNLFYPAGSGPWNDFNYFYGEKDITWARQFVAANANMLHVDNARVVLSGTSTGAIYAAFVAYGPNRAWTDPDLSSQSHQDTRVAGLVAFDPVSWIGASETLNGSGFPYRGLHWAEVNDPAQSSYRQEDDSLPDIPDSLLVAHQESVWVA